MSYLMAVSLAFALQPCNQTSDQANGSRSTPSEAASQEILVKFKPGTAEDSIQTKAASAGLIMVRELKGIGVRVYRVPAGQSVNETIEKLQKDPSVEYAEPNQEYRIPERNQQ